ncbi:MAG: hypothetical protein HYR75_05160 [Gemmatimonadetes bacterium]|nr:hypothetical protein [Gemmatimonadota bacterium]
MLFRGRIQDTSVWRRFRPREDVFAFRREGDLYVAEVATGSERSVDLFHALLEQMPPVVGFALECVRSGREFVGEGLQLAEVRETVARLKVPLVASAGVEMTVFTDDEQLSLSPMLDLWLFAKTDRWLYLLQGRGLEERAELPRRSWTFGRDGFGGAPAVVEAVAAAAARLTLHPV